MTVLLSMLGDSTYQPVTYVYDGRRCETRYVQEALCQFFDVDRHLALATPGAIAANGDGLQAACAPTTLIEIPPGRDEDELWDLFATLTRVVPAGADLLLDITHGFRSQPLFALTAAVYLRTLKQVTTRGIYYGAFTRDAAEAPVIDLTPALTLLEWATATRSFLHHGDASALGEKLKTIHASTYTDPEAPYQARSLARLGNELDKLVQALGLVRPRDVAEYAARLRDLLGDVEADLEQVAATRPLKPLMAEVEALLDGLALEEGEDLFSAAGFRAQAAMLDYYVSRQQYQQAYTLAREALVSRVAAAQTGWWAAPKPVDDWRTHPLVEEGRRKAAQAFVADLGKRQELKEPLSEAEAELAELWNQIIELRNDINHAGMNVQPRPAGTMVQAAEALCQRVADLITRPTLDAVPAAS